MSRCCPGVNFIDDVARFLYSEFCAHAVALGWGAHDLFGCDRDWPFARIDQMVLLWHLHSDGLAMTAKNAATSEPRRHSADTAVSIGVEV